MTVDATLNFDALIEAAALTVSAPWSLSGQVPVVKAASAYAGAKGINFPSTVTIGRVQYDFGSNQTARPIVLAQYFRLPTSSGNTLYVNGILTLPSGGTALADWRCSSAGIAVRDASTIVASTTTALTTNVWYYIEWKVDDAANTQVLRIYPAGSNVPFLELSGAYSGTATRVAAFGPYANGAAGVFDYDELVVADDWLRVPDTTFRVSRAALQALVVAAPTARVTRVSLQALTSIEVAPTPPTPTPAATLLGEWGFLDNLDDTSGNSHTAVGIASGAQQIPDIPGAPDTNFASPSEYGAKFQFARAGRVVGVRYQRISGTNNTLGLRAWDNAEMKVAETSDTQTVAGWFTKLFSAPLAVAAGSSYTFSYGSSGGNPRRGISGFLANATEDVTFVDWRANTSTADVFPSAVQTTRAHYIVPIYEPVAAYVPTYGTGPQPNTKSVKFTASGQQIIYGRTGLEPAADGVTSMAWFKYQTVVGGPLAAILMHPRTNTSIRAGSVVDTADGSVLWTARWADELHTAETGGITPNVWHHIAVVDGRTKYGVYLDGVLVEEGMRSQGAPTWENYSWHSGATPELGYDTRDGLEISGVRIFQSEMTQAEVVTWKNTPMAALRTLTFDAMVEGAAPTVSAPWSIQGVAPVVKASAAYLGAKGINLSIEAVSRVQYDFGSNQTVLPIVMSNYFKIRQNFIMNSYINSIHPTTSSAQGSQVADWKMHPTSGFYLRDSSGAEVANNPMIPAVGTWYYSEWKVDDANNTQTLRVYLADSNVPLFEISGAYSGVTSRVASFGPSYATYGIVDMDELTVSEDWIRVAPSTYRVLDAFTPPTNTYNDASPITVSMEFYVDAAGYAATKAYFPRPSGPSSDTYTMKLWRVDSPTVGTVLATKAFTYDAGTPVGWVAVTFDTPVSLVANQRYRISGTPTSQNYAATPNWWTGVGPGAAGIVKGPLHAPQSGTPAQGQFVYATNGFMVEGSINGGNYWIDVEIEPSTAPTPKYVRTADGGTFKIKQASGLWEPVRIVGP